jgi:hypothetical protein
MYCTIILRLFLQYLTDIEDMINRWPIMLKSKLVIPNNFISLERKMLDEILYEVDSNDMPRQLLQSVLSPL